MHRYFRLPEISWIPAIAKIRRKKISTTIVSFSKGSAEIRDYTRILSPRIAVMDRSGLSTRKTLSELSETPFCFLLPCTSSVLVLLWNIVRREDMTMTKSRILKASLRYAP